MKSKHTLRIAAITLLLPVALPTGVFAVPFNATFSFVASNIVKDHYIGVGPGPSAVHDSVSGSIDMTIEATTGRIVSLNGISFVFDGYTWQLSKIGVVEDPTTGWGAVGGTIDGTTGWMTPSPEEDFWLMWWGGSSILDHTVNSFFYVQVDPNNLFGSPWSAPYNQSTTVWRTMNVSTTVTPKVDDSTLGLWSALPILGLICWRLGRKRAQIG